MASQVSALFQHVRTEGMTQSVRMNIKAKGLLATAIFLMIRPTLRCGEATAAPVDEKCVRALADGREKFLGSEDRPPARLHASPKWHISFFLSFAANSGSPRHSSNIFEINASELGVADTASVSSSNISRSRSGKGGDFWHLAVDHGIHSSIVGTRGSFLGSLGVETSLAGFLARPLLARQQR